MIRKTIIGFAIAAVVFSSSGGHRQDVFVLFSEALTLPREFAKGSRSAGENMTGTETIIYVNGKGCKVHVYKGGAGRWTATGECEGVEITVAADDALRAVVNWKEEAKSKLVRGPRL